MSVFSRRKESTLSHVRFDIIYHGTEWYVNIRKTVPRESAPPFCRPKPDIIISYSEETPQSVASVSVHFAETTLVMRSPYHSNETRILGVELRAYGNNKGYVVFDECNKRIVTSLAGVDDPFLFDACDMWADQIFIYDVASEKIEFCVFKNNERQIVMEMKPVFATHAPYPVQIEGWVLDEYAAFLPHLCGFLGYSRLP